jgi:hypothetical protein
MQPLITRNDIARYRQISKTSNGDKLNEMILDAQLLDLIPLLGEKLFSALTTSPENYDLLLNGGIYEHDGVSYSCYGLKMVLSYFTYARHIMFSFVVSTPVSVVEKLNQDSRPAEADVRKSVYSVNRDAALKIWQNVENYLLRSGEILFTKNFGGNNALRFNKII